MKKRFITGLTLIGACLLASCGNVGEPIEKELAMQKLNRAVEGFETVHGVEIDGRLNAKVEQKNIAENTTLTTSARVNFDVDAVLDNEQGLLASADFDASLTLDAKTQNGSAKMKYDYDLEAYVDLEYLYTKSETETNGAKITDYRVMDVANLKEAIIEYINTLLVGSVGGGSEAPVKYAENSETEENLPFDITFLTNLAEFLPNPTIKTSGKTETITFEVTNDVIATIVRTIAPDLVTSDGMSQDEIDEAVNTVVNYIATMIDIKKCSASISIYDGLIISGVATDIDMTLTLLGDDGAVTDTIGIDVDGKFSVEAMDADDTIDYPSDLSQWKDRVSASEL